MLHACKSEKNERDKFLVLSRDGESFPGAYVA